MKRIICVLCAILMIGALMTACSNSNSSENGSGGGADVSADASLQEIFDEIKSETGLSGLAEFTSVDRLDRKYGITEEMVDEFAGGADASSISMCEIVLVKAADADSAAEIEKKLNNRLDSLLKQSKNYSPEQAAVIEKCKVETNGLYVSMIIAEDADKITEIYKGHFK